jgi:dienelactone hydrolase
MKTKIIITAVFLFLIMSEMTVQAENLKTGSIKELNVSYVVEGKTYKGFIAFDQNIKGKRPGVLVVHEWWGLNDYTKMRARKLAELGYVAMAVDLFGDGKDAANPSEAMELTKPLYQNLPFAKQLMDAALKQLKSVSETDTNRIAAIGYCFGGAMVLNYAKMGANLKGVVSFHGGLAGVVPDKKLLKAKVLVCQGGSDKFVSLQDLDHFKHQMDSVNASYQVIVYPNATHAFTNPQATEIGKQFNMPIEYNAEADKNSWNDMEAFFKTIFLN